jgi:class 3 adenylate cyclase
MKRAVAQTSRVIFPQKSPVNWPESGMTALREGRRQPIAVMFVDIRGFAPLAETMDPAATGRLLPDFRRFVVATATRCEGVVDKFVGDAAMLVFGQRPKLRARCIGGSWCKSLSAASAPLRSRRNSSRRARIVAKSSAARGRGAMLGKTIVVQSGSMCHADRRAPTRSRSWKAPRVPDPSGKAVMYEQPSCGLLSRP